MIILGIMCGAIFGVLIYRLGRKEGECGRVLPLIKTAKQKRQSDALLSKIENYQGK